MRICVYCSSSLSIDKKYIDLAAEVGREIARRKWSLVSGGGNASMMGAVAHEVREGGGHTIGVIPRALVELEVADILADDLIVVDTMRERKALMESHADAFLALPGGLGTLEELFEIWVGRYLGFHKLSVVVLDPDGLFAPLREQIGLLHERGFIRTEQRDIVNWTTTVEEALNACEGA
jgi:uncharacterized protein (TIGR00730 family)